MKIGFNHFESIQFIQFRRSLYRLTFSSNLINPNDHKKSLELKIVITQVIKEILDSQIERTQRTSLKNVSKSITAQHCKFSNKLKCLSSPFPPLPMYISAGKNWTSGVRGQILSNHKQPDPLKYEEWYHPSTRGVIFKHAESSTMKKRP